MSKIKPIIFSITVVISILSIYCYFFIMGKPIPQVSIEKVWDTLEENSFQPVDLTELHKEEWYLHDSLISAVCTQKDDIRFIFFVFDNEKNAEIIRKKYQSYTRENRYNNPNIEYSSAISNYIIYTIKTKDMYTVNVRVGNTLVYAYCNADNAYKIQKIMKQIGYFKE